MFRCLDREGPKYVPFRPPLRGGGTYSPRNVPVGTGTYRNIGTYSWSVVAWSTVEGMVHRPASDGLRINNFAFPFVGVSIKTRSSIAFLIAFLAVCLPIPNSPNFSVKATIPIPL